MASVAITTGIVRIVQGHPAKAKQKTDNNNQPVFKDGKPVMQWWFAIAVPKAEWPAISNAMGQAAADIPGNNNPKFAWKFKDGDVAVDSNGKAFRDKPGMAGCMILSVSTEFQPPNIFRRNASGGFDVMNPDDLKTGYFVRVGLRIDGHKAETVSQTPGLYINPQGVEFIAYGEEIFQGPDANQMFGAAPTQALPPGASATPVMAANAPTPPGMGGGPAPVATAPAPTPTAPAPAPAPAAAPLPPGYPTPSAAAPTPAPMAAPAAAPPMAPPAATPPGMAPAPIASPSSAPAPAPAPAPAYDIARGQVAIGQDANGRAIFAWSAADATGKQWPIYGWNPDNTPIYQ